MRLLLLAGVAALPATLILSSVSADAQRKGSWTWPVIPNRITAYFFDSAYARDEQRQHLGLDIAGPPYQTVVSPVTGKVVTNATSAPVDQAYLVVKDSATGEEHVLGHIASSLANGASVTKGKAVGTIKPWGATRSHVHWGVNRKGIKQALVTRPEGQWGWGRAPLKATQTQAGSLGWVNLNSSGPG